MKAIEELRKYIEFNSTETRIDERAEESLNELENEIQLMGAITLAESRGLNYIIHPTKGWCVATQYHMQKGITYTPIIDWYQQQPKEEAFNE